MTPEQAQRIANFMRRKAAGLSPNCIEFAGELREAADIIEAAAAPPQPATVEPRCDRCRWFLDASAACVRFPPSRPQMRADLAWEYPLVKPSDYCGEFSPLEVTP